jgi:hypothetical protein
LNLRQVEKSRISGSGRGGYVPGPGMGGRYENGFSDISASGSGGFGNNGNFGSLDSEFTTKVKGIV